MKRFLEKWTLWLPPLLATLFFVVLSRVTYFRYENSDDFLMVRTFLGFEGVRPVPPHLYLHPALVWVLNALSAAAPGVAWFSVAQLGMLWISAAVLCLCLLRCGRAARLHSVVCSLAALLFLGVFASFLCTRLTYTTTAALLAAAASGLLVCAGVIRRRVAPCVLLSAALLTLGGMLRGTSLPASLCFWALSLAFLCVRLAGGEAHERRALLRALVPAIVVGAVLTGVRLWEKREYAAFFDFHDARIELMDYHPQALDSVSQETLDALGWDASEVELVRQWYFMDENITADALRLIQNGSAQASLTERLQNVPRTLRNFFEENPAYLFSVLLLVLLTVLACLVPHGSAGWTRLTALAALGLFAAMLFYLAWRGRFLGRAVDCALLPAAAVAACLAVSGLPLASRRRTRTAVLCLCALLLLPAGMQLKQTLYTLTRRPDIVSPTREADLEAYALEHPDRLIVRTPDLLRDTRLFPDVSAGIPDNTLIWGDWLCRTPGWNAQLARFGFDPEGFVAADFLSEAILFVTADDEPPQALVDYISHGAGRPVTAQLVAARGDLRFFAFR